MPSSTLFAPNTDNHHMLHHVLGQSDEELLAHLETCEECRNHAEVYQSFVEAARKTFNAASGKVNLVSLDESCVLESAECDVGDAQHTLLVTLSAGQGFLRGHLTVDETCTCWKGAPVRLFGPYGLVASGRVDENRAFQLPLPDAGRRYSLGLVLTRHDIPELQIIGSFQVG